MDDKTNDTNRGAIPQAESHDPKQEGDGTALRATECRFACPTAQEWEVVNRAVNAYDSLVGALARLTDAAEVYHRRECGIEDTIPASLLHLSETDLIDRIIAAREVLAALSQSPEAP